MCGVALDYREGCKLKGIRKKLLRTLGKHWKLLTISAIAAFCIVWIILENFRIDVTEYQINASRLPEEFDGLKIVQISDFHNTESGNDNQLIVNYTKQAKPDLIFITGDFIDSRNTKPEISEKLVRQLVGIAPVYYSTGNHESRIPEAFSELLNIFSECGVHVLRNRTEILEKNGQKIYIMGIDDTAFIDPDKSSLELCDDVLSLITGLKPDSGYTILLSHRPELFETYKQAGIDLVFSGHAHGGQFRLPFFGAFYSPSEGVFPKYAEGLHNEGITTMAVSRGLGQSVIPFRVNNSPEIVVAQLHHKIS